MSKKIGIDLGTTYSCVSYVDDAGVIRIVDNIEGEQTTPSVVYFGSDGSAVVGSTAKAEGAMEPENIVERIKSYMGDPNYKCYVNGKEYSPTAVSKIILTKLIKDTEEKLGEEIEGAIITVPAYFGDGARNATKIAGESVELSNGKHLVVYQTMNEPEAAAMAYAYSKQEDMDKTLLVYDLGGGTFDCTIVKLQVVNGQKNIQIITTGGNHQLGGKDWDDDFAELVRQKFCEATRADIDAMRQDPESQAWFSENIEKAKKNLTSRETTSLTPNFDGNKARIEVTRAEFDEATQGHLEETIMLVNGMLSDKGMSIDAIDEIVLVGGSTYMPQVKERLAKEYPDKPLTQYEPNKAVAMGAALFANFASTVSDASGNGENSSAVSNNGDDSTIVLVNPVTGEKAGELKPICTKTYGMRIYRNGVETIANLVKKDTPRPAEGCTQGEMVLSRDPSPLTEIPILIMESDSMEDYVSKDSCDLIYEEEPIKFDGAVPGNDKVSVKLTVDKNGMVSLELTDLDTGKTYTMHPRRIGSESVEDIAQETDSITLR